MITLFAIAIGLSFLGSLPPGMISLTVVQTRLKYGLSRAIWMAAGAAFVEIFQVIVAVVFAGWFVQGGWLSNILDTIALVVFVGLAGYFFWAPVREISTDSSRTGKAIGFAKGMGISALNVLVFPFWIFYSGLLIAEGWMDNSLEHLLTFSLGVSLGTFGVLLAYAYAAGFVIKRVKELLWYSQKFVGAMFLLFSFLQAYRMWSSIS